MTADDLLPPPALPPYVFRPDIVGVAGLILLRPLVAVTDRSNPYQVLKFSSFLLSISMEIRQDRRNRKWAENLLSAK